MQCSRLPSLKSRLLRCAPRRRLLSGGRTLVSQILIREAVSLEFIRMSNHLQKGRLLILFCAVSYKTQNPPPLAELSQNHTSNPDFAFEYVNSLLSSFTPPAAALSSLPTTAIDAWPFLTVAHLLVTLRPKRHQNTHGWNPNDGLPAKVPNRLVHLCYWRRRTLRA